jgi:hypothetical protein
MFTSIMAVMLGLGLAAACGLRVFLPLALLSAGTHLGLVNPGAAFAWVGSWPALVLLTTACVVEVAGYCVPWLDHGLDAVASPLAVGAGALAAASQFATLTDASGQAMGPLLTWTTGLILGGSAAGLVQAGTVTARAASTVATGGVANPLISGVQSLAALAVSALWVVVPVVAAAVVLGVLAALVWRGARRLGRETLSLTTAT